jgi:hypothetical protein
LVPSQIDDLGGSETMPVRDQKHRCIAVTVPHPARGIEHCIDLGWGEILP